MGEATKNFLKEWNEVIDVLHSCPERKEEMWDKLSDMVDEGIVMGAPPYRRFLTGFSSFSFLFFSFPFLSFSSLFFSFILFSSLFFSFLFFSFFSFLFSLFFSFLLFSSLFFSFLLFSSLFFSFLLFSSLLFSSLLLFSFSSFLFLTPFLMFLGKLKVMTILKIILELVPDFTYKRQFVEGDDIALEFVGHVDGQV